MEHRLKRCSYFCTRLMFRQARMPVAETRSASGHSAVHRNKAPDVADGSDSTKLKVSITRPLSAHRDQTVVEPDC